MYNRLLTQSARKFSSSLGKQVQTGQAEGLGYDPLPFKLYQANNTFGKGLQGVFGGNKAYLTGNGRPAFNHVAPDNTSSRTWKEGGAFAFWLIPGAFVAFPQGIYLACTYGGCTADSFRGAEEH
eukprot:UN01817